MANEPIRRLKSCVKEWPDCWEGEYDPSCCRFPKSCSCTIFHDETPRGLLENTPTEQRFIDNQRGRPELT